MAPGLGGQSGAGAETEADWWKTEVEQRLLQEGMTEAQMLEAQADLGSRMAPSSEQALLAIYHGQQEHAWRRTFVEVVEGALERAGLYSRLHRPSAICFLDITGYTQLTEERGTRLRPILRPGWPPWSSGPHGDTEGDR